jgi:transcriptional regulator with XRE-family HTH domain
MGTKFAHSERQRNEFVRCQRDDSRACSSHDANMPTNSSFGDNLRAARKAKGWSMDRLAAEAETSKGYISDLERGGRPMPPGRTVERFAHALGISVDRLVGGEQTGAALPSIVSEPGAPVSLDDLRAYIARAQSSPIRAPGRGKTVERRIPVVGEVTAGVWKEAAVRELDNIEDWLAIDVDGYERAQLRAWKVTGPSMNLVYPSGRFVVTAHPIEAGLRVGDYVVVQRERAGLAEITLKEFVVDQDGRMALWPRSSDPDFQEPIYLRGGDEQDQTGPVIVGVVVADYNKRNRPPAMFARQSTWAE